MQGRINLHIHFNGEWGKLVMNGLNLFKHENRILSSNNRLKILKFRTKQYFREYCNCQCDSKKFEKMKNDYFQYESESTLINPLFESPDEEIEFDITNEDHVLSLVELVIDSIFICQTLISNQECTNELIDYIIEIYNLTIPRDSLGIPTIDNYSLTERANDLLNKRINMR